MASPSEQAEEQRKPYSDSAQHAGAWDGQTAGSLPSLSYILCGLHPPGSPPGTLGTAEGEQLQAVRIG